MRLINMNGWERICAIVFLSCISIVRPMDVKVFRQGFGKNAVEMVDETQFQNPTIISFSSDDEIMKKVDFSDEYDELVPKLPRYEVHQYGKNIGYTLVPIVTRSKPYWSTPMPRILLEKTWSTPDAIREMTKSGKVILKSTTPLPRTKPDEELLPPETNELPKKHHLSANRRPVSQKFTSSTPKISKNVENVENQPEINFIQNTKSFNRITISTTPSTQHKTHPIWHNPKFTSTETPSKLISTGKPSFFEVNAITQKSSLSTKKTSNSMATEKPPIVIPNRTRPIWHNPNFVSTGIPLNLFSTRRPLPLASTSSPEIQSSVPTPLIFHHKWDSWKRRSGDNKILQVFSTLEANEDSNHKGIRNRIVSNQQKTSEFLTGNGRHVITATSNESPVEIIMAPQTQKPIAHQKPVSDHSTQFRLLPGPHRHSSTSNNGAWSWRRQWTIGPDGKRVEVFSASGNVPKDRIPTNHHQNSQNSQNSPNLTIQPQQTKLPVTQQTETQTKFTTLSQKTGVTKCRVLDAVTDGKPAADNDFSCKLLYPGYPVDNSCKCSFHANGRDEQGCAVGFLYSCKPAENFAQIQ